jgi:PmbA protein
MYPIVFDREAMGDLFGVFASIFSGEQAIRKLTPLRGKEGQKLFSEKVTIIDDPLSEEAVNQEPFDDEGVACYKKEVVKDGVFLTLLHNLKTAKYFNTKTTGNGFKAGANIGVSATNLYLAGGVKTRDQLIAEISEGLLITDVSGLHAGANPITGDFSCQSSGFLIENGKIGRPVTLIVVSGNFLKIMNDVEELGNDVKLFHNGIGTPSVKFAGLPVSGK